MLILFYQWTMKTNPNDTFCNLLFHVDLKKKKKHTNGFSLLGSSFPLLLRYFSWII